MKKVFAIVLTILLLLNTMGYYGIFLGLKYKNTLEITERLDSENYQESETVTIKVPLVVPYFPNTEFERVNGEIEHNGEFYRLVKQKLVNDTLHIVCIRDTNSKHIKHALTDYVRTFTDQSANTSQGKTVPVFIKDYIATVFKLATLSEGWNVELSFCTIEDQFIFHSQTILSPPPEA